MTRLNWSFAPGCSLLGPWTLLSLLELEVRDSRRPHPEQGQDGTEGGGDLGEWRPRIGQRPSGSCREAVGRLVVGRQQGGNREAIEPWRSWNLDTR